MVEHSKHDVFQAISDPTRRSILKLLAEREMSIAEIAENFPISRTGVNKHLHILSSSRLVISQKIGRETRYRLNPEPLVEIQDWLTFFEHYWEDKLSALKKFVEEDNN
ncbi:transcriptional regulator [Oceanobacillus arenosus]|uniref:Transcriptional regulator n=1 Tax=Oceanobacillus arenosus TaxID=1229153 RepID=A0A3D8PYK7_9BACI|nr:metalloregulator ArsR/SmtB family transcription factor [Oceanobacillus arenosus]RDW20249.1 transcriptional regulator [Oceanobacillus arenosus]